MKISKIFFLAVFFSLSAWTVSAQSQLTTGAIGGTVQDGLAGTIVRNVTLSHFGLPLLPLYRHKASAW